MDDEEPVGQDDTVPGTPSHPMVVNMCRYNPFAKLSPNWKVQRATWPWRVELNRDTGDSWTIEEHLSLPQAIELAERLAAFLGVPISQQGKEWLT